MATIAIVVVVLFVGLLLAESTGMAILGFLYQRKWHGTFRYLQIALQYCLGIAFFLAAAFLITMVILEKFGRQ